jgi:ATP-dependent helicase/nuclease subunit A
MLPDKKAVASDPSDLNWIDQPARRDASAGKPLRPSQPGGFDYVPSSITTVADEQRRYGALAYGRLAHRLLEILPSVPASRRGDAARPIMRQYDDLIDAAKDDILIRVVSIIEMPELAPLFSRQAFAEVPINGRVHGIGVAGQIDRLYVGEDQIILADFKTGQRPDGPPPHKYVAQLALYEALLGQIYPGRNITSWLVWTQTQFIQDVTLAQRQQALQRLFANPA